MHLVPDYVLGSNYPGLPSNIASISDYEVDLSKALPPDWLPKDLNDITEKAAQFGSEPVVLLLSKLHWPDEEVEAVELYLQVVLPPAAQPASAARAHSSERTAGAPSGTSQSPGGGGGGIHGLSSLRSRQGQGAGAAGAAATPEVKVSSFVPFQGQGHSLAASSPLKASAAAAAAAATSGAGAAGAITSPKSPLGTAAAAAISTPIIDRAPLSSLGGYPISLLIKV